MSKRITTLFLMLAVAASVLALDQLTKLWVSANMVSHDTRPVIEGFMRLRYTENTGAAFGLFQGWTGALSVAAVAIIAAIVLSASRVGGGNWLMILAMGLVLGGAIGNLIDRLTLGYVRDFIEVYGPRVEWRATVYTFPVFNVADSAITAGVFFIMAVLLFGKTEARPAKQKPQPAPAYPERGPSPWFRGLDQE